MAMMNIRQRYKKLSLWNKIALWGACASMFALVFGFIFWIVPSPMFWGSTEDLQKEIDDKIDSHITTSDENHRQTQEKLDEIIGRLDPGISEETRHAVENIFMDVFKEKDIPQWQWPEKLQEVARLHQDLLNKWQTIQSSDPAVDEFRDKTYQMIKLGDYSKAIQLLQEAVEINRKAARSQKEKLDERNLSTAQLLADQARIAETRLDYQKAIDLYKEALSALPQNEQKTQALYMNNLGILYCTLADYEEAELLFTYALDIFENTYGKQHPIVAASLGNLADLYHKTNRLKDAELLCKRAIKIDEASCGPDHPEVAIRLNNLAGLYCETNRLKEAELLFKRALEIDEASFGPDHPDVAIRLHNLGGLYHETDRLKESEPLLKRALKIFENSYGKQHPNVAPSLNNLAELYLKMNRLKEAEPLLKRALEIDETSFGLDHPRVALRLHNLAMLYCETNRLKEAESLLTQAVEIMEKKLGPDYPDTIMLRRNLDKCREDIKN